MKNKKLIILGCGYVGTALAKEAIDRNVEVTALTRNPDAAETLLQLGVHRIVLADLTDSSWHDRVDPEPDWVVNCVSSAGGGLDGYRKSYLAGQESVSRWLKGKAIGSYLYTGSTGVYPQTGGVVVDESAPLEKGSGKAVILREAEERALAMTGGAQRSIVLRLAGIYGPGRHYLLDRLRAGEMVFPGRGDTTLNVIHLHDICRAIWAVLLARGNGSGIFNLADDRPAKKKEVVRWLAEQLGRPAPSFDPALASPRLGLRQGEPLDRTISNRRIKETFGWRPLYPGYKAGYRQIFSFPVA